MTDTPLTVKDFRIGPGLTDEEAVRRLGESVLNIIGAVTTSGISVIFISREAEWRNILPLSVMKIKSADGITGAIGTSGTFYLYMPEMMYFSRKWVFLEILETLLQEWTFYILREKPDGDFKEIYTNLVYEWAPSEVSRTLLQRGRLVRADDIRTSGGNL